MPSDEHRTSWNHGTPPILTDEGQKAWNVLGTRPEQAVLLLPGGGTLMKPGLLEQPAVKDDRLEILENLGERTRATVVLTSRPIQQHGLIPKGIHVMARSGWEHYHNGVDHTECGPRLGELQSFDVRLTDTLRWLELSAPVKVKHRFRSVSLAELSTENRSIVLRHIRLLAAADGLLVLENREDVEVGPRPDKLNSLKEFIPNQWLTPSAILAVGDCKEDLEVFDHLDWLRNTMEAHVIKVCASDDPDLRERADMIVRSTMELLEVLRELHRVMTR